MAFFNGVIFCAKDTGNKAPDGWDFPNYEISAWEVQPIADTYKDSDTCKEQDYVNSNPEESVCKSSKDKNWDYPLDTPNSVDDCDEGKIARLISFLKSKLPSSRRIKCVLRKAAQLGLLIGGAALSTYILLEAAKGVVTRVTNIVKGTSKIAAVLAALYFLDKMRR